MNLPADSSWHQLSHPSSYVKATALDGEGKALFGVPGPGAYSTQQACCALQAAAPAFTLGIRTHAPAQSSPASPGPCYDTTHSYHYVHQRSASPVFGTSDRDCEQRRWISLQHACDSLGAASPGPAAYRTRRGAGRTIGNAPFYVFDRACRSECCSPVPSRPPPPQPQQRPGPSDRHVPPPPVPGYTFAPHGQRRRGVRRCRDSEHKVFISPAHVGEGPDPEEARHMAGPGQYCDVDLAQLDPRAPRPPAYTFSHAPRACLQPTTKLAPGQTLPLGCGQGADQLYTAPSTLATQHSTVFAPPPRQDGFADWPDAEPQSPATPSWEQQGDGSAAGDADAADEFDQYRFSPGPGHYDVSNYACEARRRAAPAFGFGSGKRNSSRLAGVYGSGPGPGQYKIAECDVAVLPSAPAAGFGFGPRSDHLHVENGTGDLGAGAYDVADSFRLPLIDSRYQREPAALFDRAPAQRDAHVPPSSSPGPIYSVPGQGVSSSVPTAKLGGTTGHDAPAPGCFASASATQAAHNGRASPGPVYDTRGLHHRGGPSRPWWLASQDCGSASPPHSRCQAGMGLGTGHEEPGLPAADTPGPGAYAQAAEAVLQGVASKYPNCAAWSFGGGHRPELYTVAF